MEKLIIEENGFIEEEKYQRIKKEMKKKNDYFTAFEYEVLTQRLGEIWANEPWKNMYFCVLLCSPKNN